MSLTQKSIIVTGGASGIGLALTRYFASHGHRIAILDVNPDTGPKAAAEVAAKHPQAKIIFKKCDVASWDEQATAFREVFHEHGNSLDIVMANAGVAEGAGAVTVLDLEEEAPSPPCLTTLNINLIGVIYSQLYLLCSLHSLTLPSSRQAGHTLHEQEAA
jgi:NAD(P)-dependent dehydrogenase (short-subunit alcohol dehydrogenase family)